MQEIEDMTQFKQSKMTLPLARIKKIMKFDEDVKVWVPCSLFYLAWLGLCCVHLPLPFMATLTDDQRRGPRAVC